MKARIKRKKAKQKQQKSKLLLDYFQQQTSILKPYFDACMKESREFSRTGGPLMIMKNLGLFKPVQ